MWFTLGKLALKTGAEIYKNKKRAKLLESEAEVKHMERAVSGEVQLQKVIHEKQSNDLKDEFCLILLSLPLLILAYSVFFGDAELQERVDYFFMKFESLPYWYQGLVIGAFSTILGIRGVSAFKKK
tara:strand:- start:197 stop:574 length:378 start_codon:yes stop_codon:yes gene_type:complete